MKILKFGGSSLATAERIEKVREIVRQAAREGPCAVVVSALGGVTDSLLGAARQAASGTGGWRDGWRELAERHHQALDQLAPAGELERLRGEIDSQLEDLRDLLHGIQLVREASPRSLDSVSSYGERLASCLVAAALRQAGIEAEARDARQLIVTDAAFGAAQVDEDATFERLREHFERPRSLQVVTGFLGATPRGETTTLGRGGSDLTAALLGAALRADAVELWTDVSGVMSADPRLVPTAATIAQLSYEELAELSHFGAKVVHPPSVRPLREHGVRLWIKNTFEPEHPGTQVDTGSPAEPAEAPVRGVASIRRVALLRLEGDGMVGVPGTAMRLFGALAREKVNVVLISQASSEHSICFAVAPEEVERAAASLDAEFALEHRLGLVDPLVVEDDQAIVAAVGAAMRHRPGIAGRLFGVLGAHGVNVRAIAQGSSELNISLVVAAEDEPRAVRAVHDAFVGGAGPRCVLLDPDVARAFPDADAVHRALRRQIG